MQVTLDLRSTTTSGQLLETEVAELGNVPDREAEEAVFALTSTAEELTQQEQQRDNTPTITSLPSRTARFASARPSRSAAYAGW